MSMIEREKMGTSVIEIGGGCHVADSRAEGALEDCCQEALCNKQQGQGDWAPARDLASWRAVHSSHAVPASSPPPLSGTKDA